MLEERGFGMARPEMCLVPHNPSWIDAFRLESQRIHKALAGLLGVEHIGSTAVPDLIAKPILDIGIRVGAVTDFESCVDSLESLGYEHRGQHGEDPLRRYFVLNKGSKRFVQLHLWSEAAAAWDEALRFRDLLRERADLRSAYAAEKRRAAQAVNWDKSRYAIEKGPFIREFLKSEGIRTID